MKKTYFWGGMIMLLLLVQSCQKSSELIETKKYSLSETTCFSDGCTDSMFIQFDIDFPIKAQNKAALKPIQTRLLHDLFGDNYMDMDINDAITNYYQELLTEYKLDYESLIKEVESKNDSIEWRYNNEQILTSHVIYCQGNILSYAIERYVYTGGAHGINTRIFLSFDINTGNSLNEEDIFKEGYETDLTPILIDCLIEQYDDMHSVADLQERYDVNAIQPNNNFYISADGITYIFNPYEIAPYALGETEILIPVEKIKPYLKAEWQIFD